MLTEIPEKWYVLYNSREEFDIINKYFNKNWDYYNSKGINGYSTHSTINWIGDSIKKEYLIEEGYIQLSF